MNNKHLYSFDISSHIYRCYHMLLKNNKHQENGAYYNGQPTYLIRPAMQLIQSEINKNSDNPFSHIVFVFDGNSETNFRKDLYPEYKANRDETPHELTVQKRTIFRLLKAMGYPVLCIPEFEADDIIATLAKTTSRHGIKHTIFTKDKDLFALINEHTKIYRGSQHGLYDIARVLNEKGVHPSQINDYLTLLGDTSDNIKGVLGCGEKGAVKILQNYTLNQVLDNPQLLSETTGLTNKNKIIDYITNNKDVILLMQQLVKMKDDIRLNIKLSDLLKREPDTAMVQKIEESIGFLQTKKYKKNTL